MGQCCSCCCCCTNDHAYFKVDPVEGSFIVDVIGAKDIPAMDVNGKCADPYCKFYLKSAPSRYYHSPILFETTNPVWNCVRDFGVKPAKDEVLIIELWDQDTLSRDDSVGTAEVPISEITTSPKDFDLKFKDTKTKITLQRVTLDHKKIAQKRFFDTPRRVEVE
eukprot:UN06712